VGDVRVEFTVEPFVEATPGEHVTAAIDAVRAAGLVPDVGPFGTSAVGPVDAVADAVRALLASVLAAGATRISVQVEVEERDTP
jgi:uncharacterized protein YqgV (UPF0045/DUF77 family)